MALTWLLKRRGLPNSIIFHFVILFFGFVSASMHAYFFYYHSAFSNYLPSTHLSHASARRLFYECWSLDLFAVSPRSCYASLASRFSRCFHANLVHYLRIMCISHWPHVLSVCVFAPVLLMLEATLKSQKINWKYMAIVKANEKGK